MMTPDEASLILRDIQKKKVFKVFGYHLNYNFVQQRNWSKRILLK